MHSAKVVIAAAVVLAYSWWVTGLRPFAGTSAIAVVGAGMVAMALGFHQSRRPPIAPPPAAIAVWTVLVGALAAWQLGAYLEHPRSQHPTLSSLANAALDTHPARALAFAVWLAGAARLARR